MIIRQNEIQEKVRVKDQEYWVQQGEWLEYFEVFKIKEDKVVLKQVSLGSGNAQKKMEIGFQREE